ncbi:MAG: hypothetical protein ACLP5H_11850 [Desulfomonilaceae bacterium]
MSVSCLPSAECDDAHEAKQLFDVVGLLCSIFFGIPLGLVLLRMVSGLSDSIGRTAYMEMRLQTDIIFSVILAACTFVPMVYTYVRYRRKMELQK